MIIEYSEWDNFKSDILAKGFIINYQTLMNGYKVIVNDRNLFWTCNLVSSDDIIDFETNYKPNANKCIYDTAGKPYTRSESRPLDCTTWFTTAGDIVGENPEIGNGNRLEWDASIESGEFTTDGAPEGYKQKTIDLQFCDSIWLKEGTIYYMNAPKGATIDMYVLCPNNGYYMYLGEVKQNTTGDWLAVDHYLTKHPMQGDCPMGDELNTETCSQELPSYLKFRAIITVPESETQHYGYMELEIYRKRTVVI